MHHGEIEALTIFQILKEYSDQKNYEPTPVVSSIVGEGGMKQYQNNYDWLDKFDKIVICPDQDKAGLEFLDKVVKVLPRNKLFVMDLPLKDANECLMKNKSHVVLNAFWKAKSYTPSGVIGSDQLHDALLAGLQQVKIPLPDHLAKLQLMLRGGFKIPSMVNIVAPTGAGKTTYTNELIYYWIFNSPYKVGILSLELDQHEYSNVLASRHLNVKLNLLDEDEATALINLPENTEKCMKLWLNDDKSPRFYLMEERDGKLENIKKLIEQLIIACDCKIVVLDPIQDLFSGLSVSEQEEFSAWIKVTMKAYRVCFICINHIRKPNNGAVEAKYSETEVKGSSTLIQSSSYNILLFREKDPDSLLPEDQQTVIKNTITQRLTKNRNTGITGDAGSLFYDWQAHTLYDLEDYQLINPDLFKVKLEDY